MAGVPAINGRSIRVKPPEYRRLIAGAPENTDYFNRTSFLVWLKDPACIRLKYTPLATWFPR